MAFMIVGHNCPQPLLIVGKHCLLLARQLPFKTNLVGYRTAIQLIIPIRAFHFNPTRAKHTGQASIHGSEAGSSLLAGLLLSTLNAAYFFNWRAMVNQLSLPILGSND